jgi:hypothetical protein
MTTTKYTPDILNTIGLKIFTDTGMAETDEEAQFLWSWAVKHKRVATTDHEAVWWFWQMIAHRNPDLAGGYLRIKPAIIRRRLRKPCVEASEKEFRQAIMGYGD